MIEILSLIRVSTVGCLSSFGVRGFTERMC